MSGEPTIADALTDIATSLTGILGDINTQLASKDVSPADTLNGVADQISAIETGTGGITPTGTKSITTNGTHDVTTYASASVNVPTGTAKSASDITVSGNTVTVPAGLYSESASKSVPTVNHVAPTITFNTSTGRIQAEHRQSTGYVVGSNLATGKDLTTLAAQTITPTTYDQTISSGQYLTGNQTIKGDSDLVPSNIKSGVTIFNVAGTYEGGAGYAEVYKKDNYVTVSRTSTKVLAISGLNITGREALIGLVLISDEVSMSSTNYYADAISLLPTATGWYGLCMGYVGGRTFFQNTDFTLTEYNQTSCQLTSTGDVNFVSSYRVYPIVVRVT